MPKKKNQVLLSCCLLAIFSILIVQSFTTLQEARTSSSSAGTGAGREQDEIDDFILMPNYRWQNITDSEGVTEGLTGDIYYINASANANFTKARLLNSREIEFETRFLLDIGGKGKEFWEDVMNNVSDFEDNTTEYWQIYDDGLDGDQGALNGLDFINNEYWLNLQIDNDPQGYATINATTTLSIDASIYDWIEIQWFFNDSAAAFRGIDEINIYDSAHNKVGSNTTGWGDYNVTETTHIELSSVQWTGTETDLMIEFLANGTDFDTQVWVNYIYLYEFEDGADYSSTDGFKFSFLNRDQQEGMYLEFVHNYSDSDTDNYICNFVMLANSASDLECAINFDYLASRDGWLYLEMKFDLGRKDLDLKFEYENSTDIVRYRRFTDAFSSINSSYIPVRDLILLEEGFPYVAMNNTIGADARSHALIDHIQANYRLNYWVEPAVGTSKTFDVFTLTQDPDSEFTSIGYYGATIYQKNVTNAEKWFYQDIDRLDGFSFNFLLDMENTDSLDEADFFYELWNVNRNGSLKKVFHLRGRGVDGSFSRVSIISDDYDDVHLSSGALNDPSMHGKVTTYIDEYRKVVLDAGVDHETTDVQQEVSMSFNSSEPYNNEFVVYFGYKITTYISNAPDDVVNIVIDSLDIQRKDIIGQFVGGIIKGVIDIVQGLAALIFTPIIQIFMFVGKIIVDGLGSLGEFLEPLFEALGDWLSDIWDILDDIPANLWAFLWTLAEDFTDFILDDVIPFLLAALDVLVGFVADFIFWLWDAVGLPDLLAAIDLFLDSIYDLITAIPDIWNDIYTFFNPIFQVMLALYWVWLVFLAFAEEGFELFAGFGNMIDRLFYIYNFEILGIGPLPIPIAFFFIPLTYFFIFPSGSVFAIW